MAISRKNIPKSGVTVIILHSILLLLVLSYFLLMLGGTETTTGTSGEPVESYRYAFAMAYLVLIGVCLTVPITITNIIYFVRHLKLGDKWRIPVIVSTTLFTPIAIAVLFVAAASLIHYVSDNLKPPEQGQQVLPMLR